MNDKHDIASELQFRGGARRINSQLTKHEVTLRRLNHVPVPVSKYRRNRAGFTLIELLVVIAIIAILAAVLFPVLSRAREQGRAAACLSNLKQLGLAIEMYVDDYDGSYPMSRLPDSTHPAGGCTSSGPNSQPSDALEGSSINWRHAINSYIKNQGVWACPSNIDLWDGGGYNGKFSYGDEADVYYSQPDWIPISYALNGSFFHEAIAPCWLGENRVRGRTRPEVQAPTNVILLLESRESYPDLGDWWIPRRHGGQDPAKQSLGPFQSHNGLCNWLFADLHVKRLKLEQTCQSEYWTDGLPSRTGGCLKVDQIAQEYK